jgi:hypothetical protein
MNGRGAVILRDAAKRPLLRMTRQLIGSDFIVL